MKCRERRRTRILGVIIPNAADPFYMELTRRIEEIADAAGYTMVKKNWFNGVAMPAIAIREENGTIREVRRFSYDDYKSSLS